MQLPSKRFPKKLSTRYNLTIKLALDSIRALNIIVKQGNFSATSKTLHRAQSTISYQIKKLESSLNLIIFDRSEY